MKIELIIFLVMLFLSFVQWVWKVYQQKREQIEMKRAMEQREQAILRTGRDPLAEAASEQSRAERELAAAEQREKAQREAARREAIERRQEQLRRAELESRRRAQSAQPGQAAGPSSQPRSAPVTRELWPGGPVIIVNPADPSPAVPAPDQPAPKQRQQPQPVEQAEVATPVPPQRQRPVQRQSDQPSGVPSRRQDSARQQAQRAAASAKAHQEQPAFHKQHTHRLAPAQPQGDRTAAGPRVRPASSQVDPVTALGVDVPQTPEQWRRAFVVAEVLGRPLALR